MEADSSYFVTDCHNLTEEEKTEVKQKFATLLNHNGICKKRSTQVCDIADMAVICGRRTKRSLFGNGTVVDLTFSLKAVKVEDQPRNCDEICKFLKIPEEYCSKLCMTTYKRFLKASVLYAKEQLLELFTRDPNRLRRLSFNVGRRAFEPETVTTSNLIVTCDEGGMVEKDGSCGENFLALIAARGEKAVWRSCWMSHLVKIFVLFQFHAPLVLFTTIAPSSASCALWARITPWKHSQSVFSAHLEVQHTTGVQPCAKVSFRNLRQKKKLVIMQC